MLGVRNEGLDAPASLRTWQGNLIWRGKNLIRLTFTLAPIRLFRSAKGLTQTAVGDALGVTFQQVQKYERGANRIGPARLTKLSKLLGVPVSRFF
jgi:DNA-binding XRE family transcriptional regulator